MSLATRCTSCGTIFRVVQDQLRVSEGWVRCGRCAEVFDARQQLFDVEREAPPPWPAATVQEPAEQAPARPGSSALVERAMAQVVGRHRDERTEAHEPHDADDDFESDHNISRPAPASGFGEASSRPDTIPAPFPAATREEPRWVDDEPAGHESIFADTTAPAMPAIDMGDRPDVVLAPNLQPKKKARPEKPPKPAKPEKPAKAPKTAKADAAAQPSFMRKAERQARWRRPGVRVAMGAGIVLLASLLGAQAAVHFRDPLAAIYPPVRPVLASLCGLAGCEIQPWRHIDGLSVENTALSQAGQSSAGNQYQLTVALRNKSGVALAMPWIDLSLTDTAGAVVSRRTLAPSDFRTDKGAPVGNALAAGADVPMQVLLATGTLRVSGYTVEIFHP